MIHAHANVHDDLPTLENHSLRRHQEAVWKKYSPSIALLAGDALQAMGIEALASSNHIKVISEITGAIGDMGMVRGRARDLLTEASLLDQKEMIRLHDEKTGKLIASSLLVGSLLA
jgi:geranylgeranyl diphosphate synthase, type II